MLADRIAAAGIARPVNWDDMGSSARDAWEERMVRSLDRAARRDAALVARDLEALAAARDARVAAGFEPASDVLRLPALDRAIARARVAHVAKDRAEDEPCERGTVGCSVAHVAGSDFDCEGW